MFTRIKRLSQDISLLMNPSAIIIGGPGGASKRSVIWRTGLLVAFQVLLTAITLPLAIYILVSKRFDPAVEKLAAGWVGVMLTFWLV